MLAIIEVKRVLLVSSHASNSTCLSAREGAAPRHLPGKLAVTKSPNLLLSNTKHEVSK
jgi:hypothetical protein